MDCNTYGLMVELYDKQADMIREYALTAYEPMRGPLEVGLFDQKNGRQFLKRMEVPGLTLQDLHLGNTVSVYARQLKITKYSDARTKAVLEDLHDSLTLVVSSAYLRNLGRFLELLENEGLKLVKMRFIDDGGPCAVIQIAGSQVSSRWDAAAASHPPGSIRKVGADVGADYFNTKLFPPTATFRNCTLCLIRPHILREGGYGKLVSAIQDAGMQISAVEHLHLQREEATELFDVYKGVVPYYLKMIDGMCNGPLLALELLHPADSAVLQFRELCGPHDTDIARHLRPNSLRAVFGKDSARNAVHCTDLEEDGDLECQYIFDAVLKNK